MTTKPVKIPGPDHPITIEPLVLDVSPTQDTFVPFEVSTMEMTAGWYRLECEIVAEHPTGDHWIVVGRVDSMCTSPANDPLIFFDGAFRAVR